MSRGPILLLFLIPALCRCGGGSSLSFVSNQTTMSGRVPGVIDGQFLLRVNAGIVVDLDLLKAAIESQVPEHRITLTRRFENVDGTTVSTRLDRLLKLRIGNVAGTDNREFFRILKELTDESAALYFDRVDTDKYLLNSTVDTQAIDDPSYTDASQYYLDMIRWREAMEELRPEELARAVPVVAAVFDTGVDGTHEDLSGVLWQDPVDNSLNGYDGFNGRAIPAKDLHGHGTAVAGVIGAQGRNGKGIHGTAFLSKSADSRSLTEIMSVIVLDKDGGGAADALGKAVYWAVARQTEQRKIPGRENQKMILNLSLSGPFDADAYAYDQSPDGSPVLEDDMLLYASENDVLIVAAAGNDSCGIGGNCAINGRNFNKTFYYPCSYTGVLCVAASTHEDRLAGISNRGASVGLTAPGWGIYTTTSEKNGKSGYGYFSGTSEATPLVTAAASLIWSLFPHFTATDVEAVLKKSSAQIEAIRSEITSGNGRLDLYGALHYARELSEAGASPSELEPVLISTEEIKPQKAPDLGRDPNRRSADAFGEERTEDKKKSDARTIKPGCGTVRGGAGFPLGMMILLLIPIITYSGRYWLHDS